MAAILASVISAIFAWVVFTRFTRTGRPAFAAWTAGLLIFAAAAACQAIGERIGFNAPLFRAFYLLGGVLGVIWLSMGTLFLLAPARGARIATLILAALTLLISVDAAVVQVDAARLSSTSGVLGDAISHGSPLQLGAVVLNIVGTLILVGGSAWSAYRLLRDHGGADRVICNVLLTIGAFVIAAGFSAAKIAGGSLDTLGVYEAIGIAVMFVGFLSIGRFR
ncbi:MAG: hypothetical protein JF886_12730 [Candidatus Dormibacteraeota bacterium]|uniref:Histidine kinase N-terminal 7TM region domain-containing protein n=1 Tax=Candidatus Aeolococcus gillhamiae TaxID=3127015 RepID=A0A2W5YXX9_9BACT|nr:hypothetical protein [Candidatus Dormibacteraeota bacterium]PZR77772.1 MAG: hypothetical protein DLM65_14800 [Candidatus Dormibacter sp. RRmetagenome_bin12]